jgi:hypothetical protein
MPPIINETLFAVDRDALKHWSRAQEQMAKLGRTDAGGIRQHSIEDRPKLAARSANYLQYLKHRRLLLECLVALARPTLEFFLQVGNG